MYPVPRKVPSGNSCQATGRLGGKSVRGFGPTSASVPLRWCLCIRLRPSPSSPPHDSYHSPSQGSPVHPRYWLGSENARFESWCGGGGHGADINHQSRVLSHRLSIRKKGGSGSAELLVSPSRHITSTKTRSPLRYMCARWPFGAHERRLLAAATSERSLVVGIPNPVVLQALSSLDASL